jgi:hypothetical protein
LSIFKCLFSPVWYVFFIAISLSDFPLTNTHYLSLSLSLSPVHKQEPWFLAWEVSKPFLHNRILRK